MSCGPAEKPSRGGPDFFPGDPGAERGRRIHVIDSRRGSRRDSTTEGMMPNLQGRGSIALATVAVALLWSRPAPAQVGSPHSPGSSWNNLVTGTYIEITDQSMAERRLEHLEAKRRRDAAQGDAVAAERDTRRITRTRFRIGV